MISKITTKFQITIPSKIRKMLKLSRHDLIEWTVENGRVYFKQTKNDIMKMKGYIQIGDGDIEQDIIKTKYNRAHKNNE